MLAPQRIWWKPLDRLEKSWVIIAFVWCIMLTAMMPLWFKIGHQNVPTETYSTTPAEFKETVNSFIDQYQVDTIKGIPVVSPPPGDIYLLAQQWSWTPILQLEKGKTYRLHLSSGDVQHGFSLQPTNINLQVMPGYDYVATITPTTAGEYSIVCNEYCMLGHHLMLGKIFVSE